MKDVTFVLTSCGRIDLLKRTIDSFLKFNTYPIKDFIIIDDSADYNIFEEITKLYNKDFLLIFNNEKLFQIKSIDTAYNNIDTEYIFHCEDDWEFYRYGFIEESLSLLEYDDKIINVWLRNYKDTNGHLISEKEFVFNDIFYKKVSTNWNGWGGFTFNPGLRRKRDYDLLKPYSKFNQKGIKYCPEFEISQEYAKLNYYSVILRNDSVKHIGWTQHIN